mmetsp:Transcript_17654/g.43448  ORF Transcript_17654/g.43448 Transcript_17654/m.43448 type:complete len:272 (-) Transcript_17654:1054-1869(-)
MLVCRLGKTGLVGFRGTGLAERNNGIRNLDLGSHEVVLKILQTNLKVKFSRGSNDVFSGLLGVTQNHRIRFSKTLHTFNQLRKVSRVLWLNSTANNRRYRELHGLDTVGIFFGTDGSGLQQVLIDTNQSTGVSSRNVRYLLGVFAHHNNSTLNILDPQLRLLSRYIVGTHNSDLLSSGNLSGEDTSKGVESSLIRCWNHLGNVHTKRGSVGGIASADGLCGLVIKRSIIEGFDTVLLGPCRRWKVQNDHLQHSVSSWQPFLHDTLQKLLSD